MVAAQRPVLAIDIGGTKLAVAVVTDDGVTHGFSVEPTLRDEGPDAVLTRLFSLCHRVVDSVAESEELGPICAVGISCGGPLNSRTGVLINPLHLPGWIDVPIVDLAVAEFSVPAVLGNDATAAVLGEHRYGAARGADTALYLTVSTGVGGGAVIGGRLHRGAAGNGGEFGHIMVRPGGRLCMCGRLGCLEAYASGSSIALRATEAVAALSAGAASGSDSPADSVLRDLPAIRAEDVAAAARSGDALAMQLWSETLDVLSVAITDLVNVFEPDIVVLGGGVTRSGAQFVDPVRAAVLRDAMPPAAHAVRIELAALGDEVCVVGAAALAFDATKDTADV